VFAKLRVNFAKPRDGQGGKGVRTAAVAFPGRTITHVFSGGPESTIPGKSSSVGLAFSVVLVIFSSGMGRFRLLGR